MTNPTPIVRYRDQTQPSHCPYGRVERIVTGGEGGIANVHVVHVTEGKPHVHAGYHEVYYVLSGHGRITLDGREHLLRPGSVAVIPAGVSHALEAEPWDALEFVIFGTPPMSVEDDRARPRSCAGARSEGGIDHGAPRNDKPGGPRP
jgi:mannose-6-phosphate isomerase-like protein (cupin superfamily)